MKRFVLLLLSIVFAVSIEAYSKKVTIATFSTEQRAKNERATILKRHPLIKKLSKEHKFELKIRKSGKYFILMAEVFRDRDILEQFLKEVRKKQSGSYVSNYVAPKKESKKTEKKEIQNIKETKQKVVKKASTSSYAKKVFVATFSTQQRAQNEKALILKYHPKIAKLSKKHNFDLKVRESNAYFIIVAEVFHKREVLDAFLKEVRIRQPESYVANYVPIKNKSVQKKVLKPKLEKTQEKKTQTLKNNETKKINPVQKKEQTNEVAKKKEENVTKSKVAETPKEVEKKEEQPNIFEKYFSWGYFILFVLFIVFIYYFIKLKKFLD